MLLRKLKGNLIKLEGDDDIQFNEINKLDLNKINLSDYYETIIKNKYTTTLYGQFFTPIIVKEKMKEMINITDIEKTIYDPCAGIGGLLSMYPNNPSYANEINKETFEILEANIYALNINCVTKCCNSLEQPINQYDYILTNPPFGIKNLSTLKSPYNTSINMFILHCIENFKIACCMVLPIGREIFSAKMINIRKLLITSCNVLEIMVFERTKFINTNLHICIIHFTKGTTEFINYIDPDFNLIKKITLQELENNYYILDCNSYFDQDYTGTKLEDIGTFLYKSKRQASHSLKNGDYKFFKSSSSVSYINEYDYFEGHFIIFGNGGICRIHYIENEKFAASDHCFILKVNDNYNAKFVYKYLLQNITLISNGFKGVAIAHLSLSYLRNVKLELPTLHIQNEKIKEMEKLEQYKNKLLDEITQINIKIKALL